jgi:hypothetical protein
MYTAPTLTTSRCVFARKKPNPKLGHTLLMRVNKTRNCKQSLFLPESAAICPVNYYRLILAIRCQSQPAGMQPLAYAIKIRNKFRSVSQVVFHLKFILTPYL